MPFNRPRSFLLQANLQVLMDGIRGFIPEQNRRQLEDALSRLKEDLMFDASKINQLSTALYLFQEAVNSTLRSHSIKPHWMFALDNLVRAAVQAAITVLSPLELDPGDVEDQVVIDGLGAEGQRRRAGAGGPEPDGK